MIRIVVYLGNTLLQSAHMMLCFWQQAQAAAVRQVGRGGLDEEAGASRDEGVPSGEASHRRGEATAVSTAEIVRHPSETEQVLRILATHLRGLKSLAPSSGEAVEKLCVAAHWSRQTSYYRLSDTPSDSTMLVHDCISCAIMYAFGSTDT